MVVGAVRPMLGQWRTALPADVLWPRNAPRRLSDAQGELEVPRCPDKPG